MRCPVATHHPRAAGNGRDARRKAWRDLLLLTGLAGAKSLPAAVARNGGFRSARLPPSPHRPTRRSPPLRFLGGIVQPTAEQRAGYRQVLAAIRDGPGATRNIALDTMPPGPLHRRCRRRTLYREGIAAGRGRGARPPPHRRARTAAGSGAAAAGAGARAVPLAPSPSSSG
ncbi:hypothetical protein AB5I41_13580 [Sphingomonas sp. MMS24-JH45]